MRVNVYAEEMHLGVKDEDGDRVRFTEKHANEDQKRRPTFKHRGVQILVGERKYYHGDKKDDDTDAVTFWYETEETRKKIVDVFKKAIEVLEAPGHEALG